MRKLILFLILSLLTIRISWAGVDFDALDDNITTSSGASTTDTMSFFFVFRMDGTHENNLGYLAVKISGSNLGILVIAQSSTGVAGCASTKEPCVKIVSNHTTLGAWASSKLSLATWYKVVITYDRSSTSNDPVIYVNGVAETNETGTPSGSITPDDSSYVWNVGNRSSDTARTFNGVIADVAVWNKILSAQEIAVLSNSNVKRIPLQISPSNLIFYLPLDDEEDGSNVDGDTFYDLSSNRHNGTGSDGANNTGATVVSERISTYA